jgi:hypothetical protein
MTSKHPLVSGLLVGISFSIVLIFWFASVSALLLLLEKLFNGHAAGGIIGIIVVPFSALAGAPWSFMMLQELNGVDFLLACAVGILVNGCIVGMIFGVVAKSMRIKNGHAR